MEKYKPIKNLGQGAYGTVFKAVNETNNEVVAIKQIKSEMTWDKATQLPEVKALQ